MRNTLVFAMGYLRSPRRVGAIAPASRHLAAAIVTEVCAAPGRVVIEAGAGTGAITSALAKERASLDRVAVFERDARYASLLRSHYPGLEIYNQCASTVRRLSLSIDAPVTVISSLPLLSMPRDEVKSCVSAFIDLISAHSQSRLIQYTYLYPWLRPFSVVDRRLVWRRVTTIWANLPPATVWSLEHRMDPSSSPGANT